MCQVFGQRLMRRTVVGSGNVMERNGAALPAEVKAAGDGQGHVCPADLSFLIQR